MITNIIEKLLFKGQPVSEEERQALLDWFGRAESVAARTNPLTGQITPGAEQSDITTMIQDALSSRQWVNNLSEISNKTGLQIAGEFRTGNGKTPGDGFTGGRFGWPGFTYGATEYFLAGVENDVIQVGMALADGKIIAGGGDIILDAEGIAIVNTASTSGIQFIDDAGNRDTIHIVADANNDLEIVNLAVTPAGTISFFIKDTAGSTRLGFRVLEHSSIANVVHLRSDMPNGGLFDLGSSTKIWVARDGTETVFNEDSYDIDFRIESATNANFFKIDAGAETLTINGSSILDGAVVINESGADVDFRIEGDTNPHVFVVDAGNDRVEFKNSSAVAVHIISATGAVYFNENNGDVDFRVEGDTDENLFWVDAGLDAIGIGGVADASYKLKVSGDSAFDGNVTINPSADNTSLIVLAQTSGYVLVTDAANTRVGIGTNAPDATLDVEGSAIITDGLEWNGWNKRTETWTRTGNHTFTVSGDVTTTYRKGTKVRYKDGGSYEYGAVASSSHAAGTTTVTLITNTDHTMAAATITDKYISYVENPEGFPQFFNWAANPAGFSAQPSSPIYRWRASGNQILIEYVEPNNGTSNATTFTATLPVAPAYNVANVAGTLVDNGALLTAAGRVTIVAASTTMTFFTNMSSGAWTNANGKRAVAYWSYEF